MVGILCSAWEADDGTGHRGICGDACSDSRDRSGRHTTHWGECEQRLLGYRELDQISGIKEMRARFSPFRKIRVC